MVDDRASDSAPPRRLRGMHRLQLGVIAIELLDRTDTEQLAVHAKAEERDRGVDEPVEVECMNILRRRDSSSEREMLLEERTHVIAPRIVHVDDEAVQ